MNVLLIDDHFCARDGIASLLRVKFSKSQVFEAGSVEEGLTIASTTPLNLVLLDFNLPDQDGLSGLRLLRSEFPALSVVMFSAYDIKQIVFAALELGAMGFISKTLPRQVFENALQDVMSGKVFLPSSVVISPPSKKVAGEFLPISDPAQLGLSKREFAVLKLIARGLGNKDIGNVMQICEQTVKNHIHHIYRVLSVKSRAELMSKLVIMDVVFGQPEIGNTTLIDYYENVDLNQS